MKIFRKECSVFYGPAVTTRAWKERRLPLLNPASSKRMFRLAEAFQIQGRRCFILTPGIMPRIGFSGKVFRPLAEKIGSVPVITSKQWEVPWIGYMLTPITVVLALIKIACRRRIKTLVQYSFYPDAVMAAIFCKLFFQSKVILDCEDISIPSLRDWKRGSETRPVQQIWAWFLMRVSFFLANTIIVPSRKFSVAIAAKKKIIVISGCQRVTRQVLPTTDRITVLLNGGLSRENGVDIFINALKKLDDRPRLFDVKICGYGECRDWIAKEISQFKNIKVELYGTLSNEEYLKLLDSSDVCVALQNPNGRHGQYKTPSKGYEALCSGKALIVSDIGDFDLLPDNICYHVRPYSDKQVADILQGLRRNGVNVVREAASSWSDSHYNISVVRQRILERKCL